MHHPVKFHKNRHTVAEISHLTIFKKVATRHLGFLSLTFFNSFALEKLICAIMQNFLSF